ncbi:LysR family transcriptional regulator [Pseudoalteromonas xiamenensis]|uniref:LysR family transcriptional regulator n=1 Tax=Pseudoalteromonas xiamenensis TaxID=882626 RepID=UPI0027E4EE9E|nr:LysR family transcriptional regulator [Pseudoalteromonas xiamenensis]WMN59476.1 LysR family transcriptional regulator [Pseudoalteromonas xiamenensis]
MLNPIWLQTFVTLVETGHFTQTAEKLFMTQPGVSQHVSKLEQACGHSLIKRDKKSFSVTEQGQLVYEYAVNLVLNEARMREALSYDDPFSGEISIACSGSLALLLYPKLLSLQSKHAKLVMRLKAAPNGQILEEVKQGQVTLGIVTDITHKHWFDVERIGEEELCLIVPHKADLSLNTHELIMQLGLISHPDAEHYVSLYFAQSGVPSLERLHVESIPEVGFVNQIGQILEPITQGIGFTVLPKSALKSFNRKDLLKIIASTQSVKETLFSVTKKNRVLPARYQLVKEVIDSAFPFGQDN